MLPWKQQDGPHTLTHTHTHTVTDVPVVAAGENINKSTAAQSLAAS